MTPNGAKIALRIIQGYFPSESYKLTGEIGKIFTNGLMFAFKNISDDDSYKIIEKTCSKSDKIPNISALKIAVKGYHYKKFLDNASQKVFAKKKKEDLQLESESFKEEEQQKEQERQTRITEIFKNQNININFKVDEND